MEYLTQELLPFWPFIAFFLVTGVATQSIKTRLLTKKLASRYKILYWSRRLLPFLIISGGIITGFFWEGSPSPGVDGTTEKIWYFMCSACVSIAGFNVFKTWVKKKYDVEILKKD